MPQCDRIMIIDCHGHYTTEPAQLREYRERQKAEVGRDPLHQADTVDLRISDDELRASVAGAQLKLQRERGTDLTIFSPRASGMGHHIGNEFTSRAWTIQCNDLIYRLTRLYPNNFVGVCQLPQSPGTDLRASVAELQRCVEQLGFVGCNPAFHTTGSYYLSADTAAFMQMLTSDLFKDLPELKFIIPHGGGAVPYHWGRFRGLADMLKRPPLDELLLGNVFFDTCVYHQRGIDLLVDVMPVENILFASEMVGAVRGIDPETGHYFDDTRRYILGNAGLSEDDRTKIFEGNARRVYPRLASVTGPWCAGRMARSSLRERG